MTFRVLCCGAVLSFAASYAWACDNPPLAKVPTPEEADNLAQQLPGIQSEVEEYHAAMQEFTQCLQSEVDEAKAGDASDLVQNLLVKRNNAAVAEVESVIGQFNELVDSVNAGGAEGGD